MHGVRGASGAQGEYEPQGAPRPPVPRPAGPPPGAPPVPLAAPRVGPSVAEWLNADRPAAGPGVWRYGHVPRPPEKAPPPSLLAPVITLALFLVLWVLLANFRIPYMKSLLALLAPSDWYAVGGLRPNAPDIAYYIQTLYYQALALAAGLWAARAGNWAGVFRHYAGQDLRRARVLASGGGALLALWAVWSAKVPLANAVSELMSIEWPQPGESILRPLLLLYGTYALIAVAIVWPFARAGRWSEAVRAVRERRAGARTNTSAAAPEVSLAGWPVLRAAGHADVAELLTAAVRAGRMNDVDCARVSHAWKLARTRHDRTASFVATVLRKGPDAFLHPGGCRDLPLRSARHDLLTGQVRIGAFADDERNPYSRRGVSAALDPAVLGSSLLAVGPSGSGKTSRLVRPVVETLSLQALAGQSSVLTVCAAGTPLGPDDAFDVVVRPGDPTSAYDFDLYGGTRDPDEAAAILAEGLIGDVPELDSSRAALALGQLLGPYLAAHGCFPPVPELRELLAGSQSAVGPLRQALHAGGNATMLRELEARARQEGAVGDPAPALADRLALLDRPAFAAFFATGGESSPFSLHFLQERPLRVRIDLPERAHAGASRVLARLALAQFNAIAAARRDRSLFTCLVLDDATHTLTAETVRGLRNLRSVNAGAVLALRTVEDVPEELHGALLGAVGCGMIFSGVTTWDGRRFSEAWGKEWLEVREVAQHAVFADQPLTRALHTLRKLATGKAVTTEAVTVRRVERERWSASALAYELPAGHAVLSLTTVDGEHAPRSWSTSAADPGRHTGR
ncbi:hypothetical protein Sfulv_45110 [Streptomyces fulvorobeus]|uniref:ATP/GTP-binding protein n=1 Tax=Streptomyces fulvorobeus TaxID=284028 RepID=A0A7J0CAY9_9ACTN|nr:hypothetical protein Sfulv_45110 [Streptomyces fulvorobeus]